MQTLLDNLQAKQRAVPCLLCPAPITQLCTDSLGLRSWAA